MKQYLPYSKLHSSEFPQAFRKQKSLAPWGNSRRRKPLRFGLVLKGYRPQDTCKNSCFTTWVLKNDFTFTLRVRTQLTDSHRVDTWRGLIKEHSGKISEEHAISSQITHSTKGNEIMIHFLRIKCYTNGRH